VAVGAMCVLIALASQLTLVCLCYEGNWTALFVTGEAFELPPQLADEDIYVFTDCDGYDGQFYHYVAHDPFRNRGLSHWMDAPGLRYQRILVPMCAWLLAGGSDEYIDRAYYTVVLLFVFLGGYWSSRFAVAHGQHPLLGLVFLIAPPVIISLDRLTVEIALAALTAGFAFYAVRGPTWKLCLVLVAAVLTRETGLFLVGGYALACVLKRDWFRAVLGLASAVPGLLWIMSTSRTSHAFAVGIVRGGGRHFGLIRRLFHPLTSSYASLTSAKRVVASVTDAIALSGMILGCVLGIRMAVRRNPDAVDLTAALSGIVALFFVGPIAFWLTPVGYTRPFTSLFVVLGLRAVSDRKVPLLIPLLANDLRLLVEMSPRLLRALGIPLP